MPLPLLPPDHWVPVVVCFLRSVTGVGTSPSLVRNSVRLQSPDGHSGPLVGGDVGKAPNLSEPPFPSLENGGDCNLFSIRWRTLNEVTHRP